MEKNIERPNRINISLNTSDITKRLHMVRLKAYENEAKQRRAQSRVMRGQLNARLLTLGKLAQIGGADEWEPSLIVGALIYVRWQLEDDNWKKNNYSEIRRIGLSLIESSESSSAGGGRGAGRLLKP